MKLYNNVGLHNFHLNTIRVFELLSQESWKLSVFLLSFMNIIVLMVRVFANGPGQVITKTQEMVLDATLLNTQHYKVRIKGKVEQSREWSSTLPFTLV